MDVLVSVLIPVYNSARFLRECLDSVTHQSYHNLQIVIVDDGSKDESLAICKEYAEKDPRIEVHHKDNAGVAAARNDLLSYIRGDYFLFIDSDDWMEADMVEYLFNQQIKDGSDLVACDSIVEYNDAKSPAKVVMSNECSIWDQTEVIRQFLYHKTISGSLWNKLFKTGLLQGELFDPAISFGEDALFCWHLLQRVKKVSVTDRPLYHYRVSDYSLSSGSFGPKKLSAHHVWEQICDETLQWWPDFLSIAQARHCMEDTLLIRDAAHGRYPQNQEIMLLQKTVRRYHHRLYETRITSVLFMFYSFFASRFYRLASIA